MVVKDPRNKMQIFLFVLRCGLRQLADLTNETQLNKVAFKTGKAK